MKTSIQYLAVLILILFGCKKGSSPVPVVIPDTTKPTISVLKPTAGQSFTNGTAILFQATFSDNEKLKSYDIAVSQKVTGGMILKVVPISTPFSYTKSSTILSGGKTQDVSVSDITIPANTATNIVTPGTYNFKVTCVDGSDNSTSTTIEITIN
jgi:hypothetical protein